MKKFLRKFENNLSFKEISYEKFEQNLRTFKRYVILNFGGGEILRNCTEIRAFGAPRGSAPMV